MGVYETLDFEPMLLTDVFETISAAGNWFDLVNGELEGQRKFPYVARNGTSNGVAAFVPSQGYAPANPGNVITVGVSTATVFYQPTPFYTGKEIQLLTHQVMNFYSGLFLVAALRQQMNKFQWGNGASLKRLKATHIMVPVATTPNGETVPDWDGMEALGRELRETTLQARTKVLKTNPCDDTEPPELDFAPMLLTEVFEKVRASKAWYDKIQLDMTGTPRYPFVSRSGEGNGVVDFVPTQAKAPERGNVISLGLDTQTLGYQPVEFYTSQNIQILEHRQLNSDNAFVLMTVIKDQLGKFSWGGNGATLKRLKATRIMVPVTTTPTGETVPDWDGMTSYGRAMRTRVENTVRDSVVHGESSYA